MSKRDAKLLIEDMLESCFKIKKYVEGHTFETFLNDDKTIDATIRNFEIIGEAANHIDEDYKYMTPLIDWNHLRGFRNRIVHEYFGIDYEIVWTIINENLDDLIEELKIILNQL